MIWHPPSSPEALLRQKVPSRFSAQHGTLAWNKKKIAASVDRVASEVISARSVRGVAATRP
jgi:hypothetical protein